MTPRSAVLVALWLALLVASRACAPAPGAPRPDDGAGRLAVEIAAHDDRGPLSGERARLSLLRWPATSREPQGAAVVLLHGSPGSARNWEELGPRLAATGRDAWAPDLPGFGRSAGPVGGYSILAHARALLATLDALGLERAHLVAWSMGGGVALHAADLAPERVASLTLIASIGVQEAEGTGSFAFEHAKYLALRCGFLALEHLVPHFGRLAALRREGRSFALNFWQTDQRPLRAVMARLATPTLILHGREDFLTPPRAAEVGHRLIGPSRLVLYDASHFLPLGEPFGQADRVLAELAPFLALHDRAGAPQPRARVEADPAPTGLRALEPEPYRLQWALPWWLWFAGIAALAGRAARAGGLAPGLLVAAVQLDFGLAALACAAGGLARELVSRARGRPLARGALRAVGRALRPLGWLLAGLLLPQLVQPALERAWPGRAPRSSAALLLALLLGAIALLRRPRASQPAAQTLG